MRISPQNVNQVIGRVQNLLTKGALLNLKMIWECLFSLV